MNAGQKAIDTWYRKEKWPYWPPHVILARLVEEVGEFARVINRVYGPKKSKPGEAENEIEDELGDILYSLACFANSHGLDLDKALSKSIKKSHARDKIRFKV